MRFTGFNYSKLVDQLGDVEQMSGTAKSPTVLEVKSLQRFDPAIILKDSVVAHDYSDHQSRSKSPGVDIDVLYDVEKLPRSEKPDVMAPVDGKLVFVGGRDGTIKIRDENGFEHIMFHNDINVNVNVGQMVEKGQFLAKESNVHGAKTISPHVHYSVYDPETKQFLNPEALLYNSNGSVDPSSAHRENERIKDERRASDKLDRMIRDPKLSDSGTKFDSIKSPDAYGGHA